MHFLKQKDEIDYTDSQLRNNKTDCKIFNKYVKGKRIAEVNVSHLQAEMKEIILGSKEMEKYKQYLCLFIHGRTPNP